MKFPLRFYGAIFLLNAFLWSTLFIMTTGSIVLEPGSWVPNVVMGGIFLSIGGFFYLKTRYFQQFLSEQAPGFKINRSLQKLLSLDMLMTIVGLLFVIVLNVAAASRVFGEQLPIFG